MKWRPDQISLGSLQLDWLFAHCWYLRTYVRTCWAVFPCALCWVLLARSSKVLLVKQSPSLNQASGDEDQVLVGAAAAATAKKKFSPLWRNKAVPFSTRSCRWYVVATLFKCRKIFCFQILLRHEQEIVNFDDSFANNYHLGPFLCLNFMNTVNCYTYCCLRHPTTP